MGGGGGTRHKIACSSTQNRSQQNEKSFTAERKIVCRRLKNHSQEIEKSFAAEWEIVWRRLYRHSVFAFSRKEWHGSRITPFKFARRL